MSANSPKIGLYVVELKDYLHQRIANDGMRFHSRVGREYFESVIESQTREQNRWVKATSHANDHAFDATAYAVGLYARKEGLG